MNATPTPSYTPLFSYRKYWAQRFGVAPELPMSRAEMDALGWDSCDVILVTGDAYIDHPSFGMAQTCHISNALITRMKKMFFHLTC